MEIKTKTYSNKPLHGTLVMVISFASICLFIRVCCRVNTRLQVEMHVEDIQHTLHGCIRVSFYFFIAAVTEEFPVKFLSPLGLAYNITLRKREKLK